MVLLVAPGLGCPHVKSGVVFQAAKALRDRLMQLRLPNPISRQTPICQISRMLTVFV